MATAVPSTTPTGWGDFIQGNAGAALGAEGITWPALLAAIGYAFASFGAQLLGFVILRWRLSRIYRPRTYLVPERERVPIPPHGIVGWLKPIFATPSLEYIRKCGLDAYFFLRYLRMLLKIFFPMAVIILPVLLPINRWSGADEKQDGLDLLSISNVAKVNTKRLWAHLILAVGTIIWVCYVIFKELRGFIRVRQAYLTSPQHRIRASATTVLVTGIPKKWLTLEALEGLYDVFPGGIRNIWINRNYDELADKVSLRDGYAKSLEESETNLIQMCRKKHLKKVKKNGTKEDYAEAQELKPVRDSSSGSSDNAREKQPMRSASDLQHQDTPKIPTTKSNNSNDMLSPMKTPPSARPEAPRIPTNVLRETQASFHADDKQTDKHTQDDLPNMEDKVRATGLRKPSKKPSDEIGLRESADQAAARPATAQDDMKAEPDQEVSKSKWADKFMFWKSDSGLPKEYPSALNEHFDEDKDEDATWRKYIKPEDRETMRLPLVDQTWFPSLPLMGKQVDKIYWLRREVARINLEISDDQNNVERFPYMNSAFIQFNHQVAAHMCCQSVSHHVPQHMAPRTVEISPDDVLWDNLSIKWWERYIRVAVVIAVNVGLVILYAIPVGFTSLLSKLSALASVLPWLSFLLDLPDSAKGIIQGVLPPALLQVILILVPVTYRFLVKLQGVPTGNARELGVQIWYFIFLFIQVFFVVSISGGLTEFFKKSVNDPAGIADRLSDTLPKAANYFFSYLMIQSLSSSASALLQVVTLLMWFIVGPIMDSTPREKWRRQTTLAFVRWGSFFPPFTNFAVIGLIYSCIAPLILVFMLIIFSLFWIVYRYNVLYVYRFRQDTGGLLFPMAVHQLFTGLYVMQICLAGFFFARGPAGDGASSFPQGIIMVVCVVLTAIYQLLLNSTFNPLIHFLPITLEDEAVIRDEEFARTQAPVWEARARASEDGDEDIQHQLEERERAESRADDLAEEVEKEDIARRRRMHTPGTQGQGHDSWHNSNAGPLNAATSWHSNGSVNAGVRDSWHNSNDPEPWKGARWGTKAIQPVKGVLNMTSHAADSAEKKAERKLHEANARIDKRFANANGLQAAGASADDEEAQKTVADVLFAGVADELEDLTPEERDLLVRYAFQHAALRSRRPTIWIPRDALGISDDAVRRGKAVSGYLEYSNVGAGLDAKGRAVFEKSPPDFRDADLIAL